MRSGKSVFLKFIYIYRKASMQEYTMMTLGSSGAVASRDKNDDDDDVDDA